MLVVHHDKRDVGFSKYGPPASLEGRGVDVPSSFVVIPRNRVSTTRINVGERK